MIYMEEHNPKTIAWLQSHGWYRFLKVVYFLALLIVLAFFNAIAFSGVGQSVSHVILYGNLIILIIFEIIRRIFYYVVLGRVVPGK